MKPELPHPLGPPSSEQGGAVCRKLAIAGSFVGIGLAGLAIIGRSSGHLVLAGKFADSHTPMLDSTAAALILLGLAVICQTLFAAQLLGRACTAASALLLAALGLVHLLALWKLLPAVENWPLGLADADQVMPWFTSWCCLTMGAALLAQTRPGEKGMMIAGVLSLGTCIANLWILLRYVHGRLDGSPVNPDGAMIAPVSLTTSLAWTALAVALIAAGGPRHFLVRPFIGSSTYSLLLRSFLPVTVAAVLVTSALYGAPMEKAFKDTALLTTLWTFLSAVVVTLVILRMSRNIGARIDRAEAEKKRAVDEMGQLRAHTVEMQASRDAAQSAGMAKMQFLANMSHELRTPLTAIIGYVELLQEEAQQQEHSALLPDLTQVHVQSRHLQTLINDLFDMSRIEAGTLQINPTTFDVAEELQDVVRTVGPLVVKNGNTFERLFDEDLGLMRSDPLRLKQCLYHLLTNAGKFTENGTVALSVRRATRAGQDWLVFEVKDTGIGMSPEQFKIMIEPFAQADRSTTRKHGGTGLGLAITHRLCQMMGGELGVDSALGHGATLAMHLPRAAPGQMQPAVPARDVARPDPDHVAPSLGPDAETILVIDDEKAVRDVLKRILGKEGFRVVACGSGQEGLRLAREIRPQAITLDVMMPAMDGWSVLAALKADPSIQNIPVIMLTVMEDRNLGYALGAADYLTKPLDRSQLLEVLHRRLGPTVKKLALIVDDESALREMLHRSLERSGWDVVEAADGQQALEQLRQRQPTLVVLDLLMPKMNGFEVLSEIRQHPEWQDIPVIVLTAKDLTEEERQFLSGSSIVTCVRRVLQKGQLSSEQLLREVSQATAR